MPGKNDVWYLLPSGQWGSVKNDIGISRNDIRNQYDKLYGTKKVPNTWVFNDFGPVAIRYFKDLNANRKLDKGKGESLSGEMIHTTWVRSETHFFALKLS